MSINDIQNTILVNPNGNVTALVRGIMRLKTELREINDLVMEKFPEVEQVAFFEVFSKSKDVMMTMAGEELCVNALRALAYYQLKGKPGQIEIKVAGLDTYTAGVDEEKNAWVSIPMFASAQMKKEMDENGREISTQVNLPGMTHLLLPFIPKEITGNNRDITLNQKNETFTELATRNLDQEYAAAGVMYYEICQDKVEIMPLVWVRDIATFILEQSCGSGTLAIVGKLYKENILQPGKKAIFQFPSGEVLYATIQPDKENVIISGKTSIIQTKESMSKQSIPQNLKGFRDFLPKEALKRNWLKNKITNVFELWGYDPLETPTLEPLELFIGQIGEDEKLFFKFKDPGDRDVALRYDQTVPTCRVVGQYEQELPMPFRRYQIQSAYRAENTQRGRYREFLQCDADIFGIESAIADAEVIALSLDIYRQLGFPQAQVLINDRALLKDMPYEAIVAIDKLEKIGEDGVVADMVKKGISAEQAKKYLDYVQKLEPNETVQTILDYLEKQGFDKSWYKFDPTIARSFSYSTGPIWEVKIPGFSAGSVLGGERFDKLIEKISGKSIPGTGFGLGFDRTLEAAEQFGLIPEFTTQSQVLVTVFEPKFLANSLETASQLRAKGVRTELFPDSNEKLAKQVKYANKKGIPFVIVIGEDEVKQKKVMLKNMASGEQKLVSIEEVVATLK